MADMLVALGTLPRDPGLFTRLEGEGIVVKRALSPDLYRVQAFIEAHAVEEWGAETPESWKAEATSAMAQKPPGCFVAVEGGKLVGFACYDATAKGYFGPTAVAASHQGRGIGKALLLSTLQAMWDEGYGYAIIGWPASDAIPFYEKTVGAWMIPGGSLGVYTRLI